jgi:thymidylate synthase
MSCANASELFHEMLYDIQRAKLTREVSDSASPAKQLLHEAEPRLYRLDHPQHNVMDFREIDTKWAVANVLHIFSATEFADPLLKYNKDAKRFLAEQPCPECLGMLGTENCKTCNKTGATWMWNDAYGFFAVPSLKVAVDTLKEHPDSRRAVVTMPDIKAGSRLHQPACWNKMQLLKQRGVLNLLVSQRSLHLTRVGPYDCILFTNTLLWAAAVTGIPPGSLYWFSACTHCSLPQECFTGQRNRSLVLPAEILSDPKACWDALCNEQAVEQLARV